MGAHTGCFWIGRRSHVNSLHLYLKLLFQQHGLKQLLAKHSPSLSFKNGSFVLIFFAVIFCEFSYSELGTHFPNWTLRHTPTPQITNFLKARSRCHPVTAHLEESLTTSECLCGHYFDQNLWDSRKLSFFLDAQVAGIRCGNQSSQSKSIWPSAAEPEWGRDDATGIQVHARILSSSVNLLLNYLFSEWTKDAEMMRLELRAMMEAAPRSRPIDSVKLFLLPGSFGLYPFTKPGPLAFQ